MKKITKAFVISACMPIAFACFGCGDTDKQSYALFSEPVVTGYIIDDNFRQVGVYGETESIKVDGKFVYKLNYDKTVRVYADRKYYIKVGETVYPDYLPKEIADVDESRIDCDEEYIVMIRRKDLDGTHFMIYEMMPLRTCEKTEITFAYYDGRRSDGADDDTAGRWLSYTAVLEIF